MKLDISLALRRLLPALLLLVLPSCDVLTDPFGDTDRDRLRQARARWEAQNIRSYTFSLSRGCFCGPEITREVLIEVSDGVPVSVVYTDDGEPAERSYFEAYDTIDELFDLLAAAYDRDAKEVNVTYEPIRGTPTEAYIDYDYGIADEEQGWRAGLYERLE